MENHKHYFDWSGGQLGYTQLEDWYNITASDWWKWPSDRLLRPFSFKALQSIFPNHDWMIWRFKKTPQRFWEGIITKAEEQGRILDWLSNQLSIEYLEDWYRVSLDQIQGLTSTQVGSETFIKMLQNVYPNHLWDMSRLNKLGRSKASQRAVVVAMKELFPKCSKISKSKKLISKGSMRNTSTTK